MLNPPVNGKIQVLFKANFILKDFSRQSCVFKYFSSLCEPCNLLVQGNPINLLLCLFSLQTQPPIQLLHCIKPILCYKEEGSIADVMNEMDLKFTKNHYFFEPIQNYRIPKMLFNGFDVNLRQTLNSMPWYENLF